jgi:hypothetical protein
MAFTMPYMGEKNPYDLYSQYGGVAAPVKAGGGILNTAKGALDWLNPVSALTGLVTSGIGAAFGAESENEKLKYEKEQREKELQLMYQQFALGKKTTEQQNAQSGMDFINKQSRVTRGAV